MKWLDILAFNKVAETASLTRAGKMLALSRSAVSKRITRLEQSVDAELFCRSPRSIRLSAAGERFYDHTMKLERDMILAQDAIKDTQDSPHGLLSLTMPTSLGASLLPILMREFRAQWPELQIRANLDDQYLDIVGDGYDVAVRVSKRTIGPNLRYHEFARTPEILLASPGYLQRHGKPTHVRELRDHQCLAPPKHSDAWRFITPSGTISVDLNKVSSMNNDMSMILAACLDGGILRAPKFLVESELQRGYLTPILGQFRSNTDYGVFAVYPDREPPARVRVFIEFLEQWLPKLGDMDRWNPLRLNEKELRK